MGDVIKIGKVFPLNLSLAWSCGWNAVNASSMHSFPQNGMQTGLELHLIFLLIPKLAGEIAILCLNKGSNYNKWLLASLNVIININ